jgi:hypothetical protein
MRDVGVALEILDFILKTTRKKGGISFHEVIDKFDEFGESVDDYIIKEEDRIYRSKFLFLEDYLGKKIFDEGKFDLVYRFKENCCPELLEIDTNFSYHTMNGIMRDCNIPFLITNDMEDSGRNKGQMYWSVVQF